MLPGPHVGHIANADLRNTAKLLALYDRLVHTCGLHGSAALRLQVVALAEHALTKGKDPCALFAPLLRAQRWEVITQADEDRARHRMATYRNESASRACSPCPIWGAHKPRAAWSAEDDSPEEAPTQETMGDLLTADRQRSGTDALTDDLKARLAAHQAKRDAHDCTTDGYRTPNGTCDWCMAWEAEAKRLWRRYGAGP